MEINNKFILSVDLDAIKIYIQKENNNENIYCDFYEDNNDNFLDQNDFSQENFNFNNCELPLHYKKKLEEWIKNYQKELKNNYINEKKIEFESKKIYEFFFYFFVSILKDYNIYLNKIDEDCKIQLNLCKNNSKYEIDINKIFNIKNFISNVSNCDKPFYYLFFRTKMFKNFIMKKICPKNIIEKLEILYFDERINEKNNKFLFKKKSENIFINNNFINDQIEEIKIEKIEKIINFNQKNLNETIKFFQIFSKNNNNKFIIKYPIFPKLFIDYKLLKDKKFVIKNYFNDYIKFFEEFYEINLKGKSINSDCSINYNVIFNNLNNDFSDYIYLNWIILLCLSYNYINTKIEKKVTFQLLITKIKTLKFLPNEILIFIYKIFLKFGDCEEIIFIYEIINNNFILRNNYTLYNELIINLKKNIIVSEPKRTFSYSSRMSMIKKKDQFSQDNLQINLIEKRGLFNKENEKETFIFENSIKCIFCNKYLNINFKNIINNFKKNIICDLCKKEFVPNMYVKINKEIKNFEFLNPFDLFKEICNEFIYDNNQLEFNIKNFYEVKFQIFWNAIFSFIYKNLNYEFLFPYLNDVKSKNNFKEKEKGYKNLIITKKVVNFCYVPNFNNLKSIAGTQKIYKNINVSDFSLEENNKNTEINDDNLSFDKDKIIFFKNK